MMMYCNYCIYSMSSLSSCSSYEIRGLVHFSYIHYIYIVVWLITEMIDAQGYRHDLNGWLYEHSIILLLLLLLTLPHTHHPSFPLLQLVRTTWSLPWSWTSWKRRRWRRPSSYQVRWGDEMRWDGMGWNGMEWQYCATILACWHLKSFNDLSIYAYL